MPLILMVGLPSSGKTTRALEIQKYFKKEQKEVILISDNEVISQMNINKNVLFLGKNKIYIYILTLFELMYYFKII